MTLPQRMKFGIFLAPFHPVGENPTVSFERNLELIRWLDDLDYCPICDGDNGETYLIESTTLDNWSG